MKLIFKKFSALSPYELYSILKLRFDVFVIEQQSLYDELDGKDAISLHAYFSDKKGICAYARIFKTQKKTASIGRIVVRKDCRKKGFGRTLIAACITHIQSDGNTKKIEISAQEHLKPYYASFGFRQSSPPFDDGGIAHIDMTLLL